MADTTIDRCKHSIDDKQRAELDAESTRAAWTIAMVAVFAVAVWRTFAMNRPRRHDAVSHTHLNSA